MHDLWGTMPCSGLTRRTGDAHGWAYSCNTRLQTARVEPYLTPSESELFMSGLCDHCWRMATGTAQCSCLLQSVRRKSAVNGGFCQECKLIQLCSSIGEFVARHAAYIDQQLHDLAHSDPNYFAAHFQGIDGQTLLTADFFDVVMVFGLADGSLEPSATALSLVALLLVLRGSRDGDGGQCLGACVVLRQNLHGEPSQANPAGTVLHEFIQQSRSG